MSGIDVDKEVLGTIAGDLDRGAAGLEDVAGSVPSGVQAGPMTGVIASMLSQVTNSAGNTSSALTGAAEMVRLSRRYYDRADADADAGMTEIQKAMKP